jgi:hypothetical protein
MALRDGDREWLRNEIATQIAAAVEPLKPRGFRKLLFLLREWGLVAANITVFVGLLAIVVTAVYAAVNRSVTEATFQQKTNDHFDKVEATLLELKGTLKQIQEQHGKDVFNQSKTVSPEILGNEADGLAKNEIFLPRGLVAEAGANLLRMQPKDATPSVWEATEKLLNYISYVNRSTRPNLKQDEVASTPATNYSIPTEWHAVLREMGASKAPLVPELHPIQLQNENLGLGSGPSYLILSGGTIKLDGMVMRRVIITDATVVYEGSPVVLEDIRFINCTFTVKRKPQGELFALAVFSPSAATAFRAS